MLTEQLAGTANLSVIFASREGAMCRIAQISGLVGLFLLGQSALAQTPAFPGAQGYGAATPGGRGGSVIYVTNTNDSGTGSLRAALTASGKRTVVFRVGGVIVLDSTIEITNPFLTIAGQTAPGDGVCIRGGNLVIKTNDVIIRHFCARHGDDTKVNHANADGITIDHGSNIMIDHFSTSWSLDEAVQTWFSDAENITFQYSLFGEPLNDPALRPDEGHTHGYGPLFGNESNRISFHHNVVAHAERRSPRMSNVQNIDVVNNYIYNWGSAATQLSDDPASNRKDNFAINIVNNIYKPGPNTNGPNLQADNAKAGMGIYISGNTDPDGTSKNTVDIRSGSQSAFVSSPVRAVHNISTDSTNQVAGILATAGRTIPKRDPVDAAIIATVQNGGGKIVNRVRDSAAGGWPTLRSGTPYPDQDKDGMSDTWESQNGLNPNNASDRNADNDGDGYTNLEEFLNELAGSPGSSSGSSSGGSSSSSGAFPTGACHAITSSQILPAGFGSPLNEASTARELLLSANCTGTSATLSVGNDLNTLYVYSRIYVWETSWQQRTLLGNQVTSDWLRGRGSIQIPRPSQAQHFVAYTCHWTGSAWKCGCRDQACAQSFWQLQSFR